ncbi:unnamed protein product [Sphagnum balticum]
MGDPNASPILLPPTNSNSNDQTPLETLANTLAQSDQMSRVRAVLESIYGKSTPKRQSNFTIVGREEERPNSIRGSELGDGAGDF